MRVTTFVLLFLSLVTALTVYNHYLVHGVVNATYIALVFFLVLNMLICYWELCLLFRIDFIKECYDGFQDKYLDDKSQPAIDFLMGKMTFRDLFSMKYWSYVWSTYAMFDGSYADKRTFGFGIDIGNGMSTLIPCLILHLGFTYHFLPANILGIVAILFFYQVTYGTTVYWVSFIVNKRYKLISVQENIIYILGSNVPWVIFGIIGIYASVRLILENNYSVFGI